MKQDCAVSQSTADEIKCFQTSENNAFLKGTYVSEPDEQTGSVVKKCPEVKTEKKAQEAEKQRLCPTTDMKNTNIEKTNQEAEKYNPVSWSYLFIHHTKVMSFEEQLKKDGLTYFVHKTIKNVIDIIRGIRTFAVSGGLHSFPGIYLFFHSYFCSFLLIAELCNKTARVFL